MGPSGIPFTSPRAGISPWNHRRVVAHLPNVALHMAMEREWALLEYPSPNGLSGTTSTKCDTLPVLPQGPSYTAMHRLQGQRALGVIHDQMDDQRVSHPDHTTENMAFRESRRQ